MKFQVIELLDSNRHEKKKSTVLFKLFSSAVFFLLSSKPDERLLDGKKKLAHPHLNLMQ